MSKLRTMNRTRAVVLAVSALGSVAPYTMADDGTTSLIGSYRLIERTLEDGTVQRQPTIEGLMTYTANYKNFNAIWTDPSGKAFSFSAVAEYKLTGTSYSETLLFSVFNMISDKQTIHQQPRETKSAPAKGGDGRVYIELPFDDGMSGVFQNGKATYNGPGFVDVWQKVE